MSTFNRGLDDAFVDALNEEYDKNRWWHRFVDDKEIFFAIRKNYVNAYYRGCSLLKLSWKHSSIVGEIHYKYLLRPSISNEYVKVEDGRAILPNDTGSWFLNDMSDIDNLKKAVKPRAKDEKRGVHNIIHSNPNILDVEIAFGTASSRPSARRLDFAAIQDSSEGAKIVFFEAKHFRNKELRADDDAKPQVVRQIEDYSRELQGNRDAVIDSYHRVCRNLRSLHGMAERHPERHAMLESVVDGSRTLLVAENPVLVVFGFDEDQKKGKRWEFHRKKLEKMLCNRLLPKGVSDSLVVGISK